MMAEMERSALPLSRLPQITRLFSDFLQNFPKVSEFYAHSPDEAGIVAAAREAQASRGSKAAMETRGAVVEVLRRQNQNFGADESLERNLDRLRDGAVAIVTGQQTALFGGPAYTIYKAITAIHWARWLSERDIPAAPIFWMATEDHDFAEVNHVIWPSFGAPLRAMPGGFRRNGTVALPVTGSGESGGEGSGDELMRLEIQPDESAKGGAVGGIVLDGGIERAVERAMAAMHGPRGTEIGGLLRMAYRAGETMGGAFGKLMAWLFAGRGLILLDSLDIRLHRLAAPIFRAAAEQAETVARELIARGKALERAGYHSQVRVTPRSTLLFRFVNGKREPVRRRGEGYAAGKMVFNHDELLAAIDQHPEEFSPNALLRPVMQDALLPTAAYVGGPAEVAYFAQSEVLYRGLQVQMPAVLPRASFTLVDARTARILRKYKLNVPALFQGRQRIREKMEQESLPKGLARRFRIGEQNLTRLLKTLRSPLRRLDSTLLGALDTAQRKILYQYAKLGVKAGRAEGFRTGVLACDERRLADILYSKRGLQERTLSALPFMAAQTGNLIDELVDIVHREGSGEHHIVSLR
jgi:bacillithiol biosynthesis cysteine-adding enzyme BshC